MSDLSWASAKNILVVRLDNMGDVLMTTPAIRALKESLPGRRITLLASEGGAAIAPFIPEIDDVIVYEAPWIKQTDFQAESWREFRMVEILQNSGFDGAVIFTVYSQNPLPSAFLCHLAGIRLRLAHCHENPYQLLSHWIKDPEPYELIRHEVRRQLDLVASIGAHTADERLSLTCFEKDLGAIKTQLVESGLDLQRPWVLLHPGASAPSRRYPIECFAETAHLLASGYGFQIVINGNSSELDLAERIHQTAPNAIGSLVGKLNLGEMIALISLAPILITNNTGPAHIAAARGTPVVDLYALTNPQHTPWMVPSRVLSYDVPCKYCYKSICPEGHQNCLQKIEPKDVVQATLDLLEEVESFQVKQEAAE